MYYLRTTEAELGIDLDRPISEQDPLDILNDLANKKRKNADDIHDFFRANKRLKLHQGPGLDDHARTFSSLLLAEIHKRNLNPLKGRLLGSVPEPFSLSVDLNMKSPNVSQAEVFQLE
ncbi:hypothetical protein Tco_0956574 [Tanacetum coccineum]